MQANDRTAAAELVLAADDGYRVRLTDRGWSGVGRRRRVLHPGHGRSAAGGAHRAADRRSGHHAAARKSRSKRGRTTTTGSRSSIWSTRRRPRREDGALHAASRGRTSRASVRICSRPKTWACSPVTSSPTTLAPRDVARGKPSSETSSDMFFLEVKPFNEEFVQAQSQAMGGGRLGHPDRHADRRAEGNHQRDLEPRAPVGRRTIGRGLKAVAEAQAELKGAGRADGRAAARAAGAGSFRSRSCRRRARQRPQRRARSGGGGDRRDGPRGRAAARRADRRRDCRTRWRRSRGCCRRRPKCGAVR